MTTIRIEGMYVCTMWKPTDRLNQAAVVAYQRSLLAVAGLDALDGELGQLEVGAELDGLAMRVPFQQELPGCLGDCKTS